jgi:peptide/nickel transport system substrate-binding protein
MLALDRKAFIDIIGEGQGEIGATMQPLPNGVWGMPSEMLRTLPGYDPDIAKNREQPSRLCKNSATGQTDGWPSQ